MGEIIVKERDAWTDRMQSLQDLNSFETFENIATSKSWLERFLGTGANEVGPGKTCVV